jgi:hypothetical protein
MTSEKIERYLQEGRGAGHGSSYKPWLTVFDFPSRGQVTREIGIKTDRIHHTFSQNESRCLDIFQLSPPVVDVREQFPLLPLSETKLIADKLGIKHPSDPSSKCNIVMTTDFLLDVSLNGATLEVARTVKPKNDLSNIRTIEKFEIERRYWSTRGVDWGIIIADDIPMGLAQNCQFLTGYYQANKLQVSQADINDVFNALTPTMLRADSSFRIAARGCDQRLGLKPGTSLMVGWHLIATREWLIDDWNKKLEADNVIQIKLSRSNVEG